MLAVPRVQECYLSVSINALGFAGSLFVKERKQLEVIRSAGPMRALEVVAGGFT
jgi:ATP adenylyltransferase